MSEVIFNEQAFYSHLGGDIELGKEILKVYIVDAPDRVSSLGKALEADDMSQVIKYSHALKGISATIRASVITSLAERVELSARKGDLDYVRECMPEVVAELDNVLEVVREHLSI